MNERKRPYRGEDDEKEQEINSESEEENSDDERLETSPEEQILFQLLLDKSREFPLSTSISIVVNNDKVNAKFIQILNNRHPIPDTLTYDEKMKYHYFAEGQPLSVLHIGPKSWEFFKRHIFSNRDGYELQLSKRDVVSKEEKSFNFDEREYFGLTLPKEYLVNPERDIVQLQSRVAALEDSVAKRDDIIATLVQQNKDMAKILNKLQTELAELKNASKDEQQPHTGSIFKKQKQ